MKLLRCDLQLLLEVAHLSFVPLSSIEFKLLCLYLPLSGILPQALLENLPVIMHIFNNWNYNFLSELLDSLPGQVFLHVWLDVSLGSF